MFRLRSKSGDESVFRSAEEIRSALLSGFVTPDAQIWDAELKGWVPLLEHALYKQIAAPAPGRKSGAVKGPPSGATKAMPPVTPPAGPKGPPKLVIKRPGDAGTTAMPAVKPPAPPAPPQPAAPPATGKPADEMPDLELIDLDLTPEPEPVAPPPPPAPKPVSPPAPRVSAPPPAPPAPPAAPPKRPTPPPAPTPAPEPERVVPAERVSTPRMSAPRVSMGAALGVEQSAEVAASGGSKKGLIIGAILVIAAGGGGFALLGGKKGELPPAADSTSLVAATTPPADSTPPDSATAPADSAVRDSAATAAPQAPADTPQVAAATAAVPPAAESATVPASGAPAPVPFAPNVGRGPTPWTARPVVGVPLTLPALEVVRLRYLAAQGRALEQFEAGLEAAGFSDMFDPGRISNSGRRDDSFDAVDQARTALRDFRRRQTAIDFAYTDSMRQALPAGSDAPDFRTFGPILRETPAQAALTDSLISGVAEQYGMLVNQVGAYTFRGGMLTWTDPDDATRYRELQEQLTSQIARIRQRSQSEVPPAMAAVLRGIGLPR
jgi:hypothetical protein